MASNRYSGRRLTLAAIAAGLLYLPSARTQGNILSTEAPPPVQAKRGATAQAKLKVSLQSGYHVNSNTPSDDYLIPLKLTWTPGPLESPAVSYPKPQMEKYEFSEKPLSVLTGNFELNTTFKVPANAPVGPSVMAGKLRYQACNNKACFPPKSIDVKLPVQVQ